MNQKNILQKEYRKALIFYLLFIVAIIVYIVILKNTNIAPTKNYKTFRNILYIVSVMHVPALLFLRHIMLKVVSPTISDLAKKMMITTLQTGAFAEAIAIYGLVLGFQGANSKEIYPLFAFAFILLLIFTPRYYRWEEKADKINNLEK